MIKSNFLIFNANYSDDSNINLNFVQDILIIIIFISILISINLIISLIEIDFSAAVTLSHERTALKYSMFAIYDYKNIEDQFFASATFAVSSATFIFRKKNLVHVLIGRDRFWVAAVNERVD